MRFEQNMRSQRRNDFDAISRLACARETQNRMSEQRYGCGNCNCNGNDNGCNRNRPIAMVYSEKQGWGNLYDPEIGFNYGTIFCDLNLPLNRTGCSRSGGCTR